MSAPLTSSNLAIVHASMGKNTFSTSIGICVAMQRLATGSNLKPTPFEAGELWVLVLSTLRRVLRHSAGTREHVEQCREERLNSASESMRSGSDCLTHSGRTGLLASSEAQGGVKAGLAYNLQLTLTMASQTFISQVWLFGFPVYLYSCTYRVAPKTWSQTSLPACHEPTRRRSLRAPCDIQANAILTRQEAAAAA